jgi:hypothetical protein
MLFIDIEMFKELTGLATDPMRAFHAYAAATFGREAFEGSPQDALDDLAVRAAEMSKREFFVFVMDLIAHGRAAGTMGVSRAGSGGARQATKSSTDIDNYAVIARSFRLAVRALWRPRRAKVAGERLTSGTTT